MSEPLRAIDLQHLGHPGEIAAWVQGDVLIDCGRSTCLARLTEQLGDIEPRVLLLTHIHLDHAGAAGSLVERWPALQVHVHPIGLPHVADPSKLIRSAGRLYGDDMDRLWGEIKAVPEHNLHAVEDGAELGRFLARHTPGHASHHVAYLDQDTGCCFPGDAAGVRLDGRDLIMPHAPPPDIDLDAWQDSLDLIEAWAPRQLCLPHFGPIEDVGWHLDATREAIARRATQARSSEMEPFVAQIESDLAALNDPAVAARYRRTSPPEHMYLGLKRFWDKRDQAATPA
jgi:glyoxylase-like metal-dependent hydrolase (beta-lactamase superfamily II)